MDALTQPDGVPIETESQKLDDRPLNVTLQNPGPDLDDRDTEPEGFWL